PVVGRARPLLRCSRALHVPLAAWSRSAPGTPVTPVHKFWLLDVLDILLVAVLFYRLLVGVKGTRSAQMFVGLLVLVIVSAAARFLGLIAVDYIATNLRTVWLITFVILFQPELRHALAQFGRTRYFRSFLRVD